MYLNAHSRKREYFPRSLSLRFYCAFLCSSVSALDRDRTLTQFHHTAWTARDGAQSQISALAQTEDGYLWIGSARGLFRFDGVEFEPYVPPADVTFPTHNIISLLATSDGGWWIAFRPYGLAFLKAGQMKVFSRPEELPRSEVFSIAQDMDGRIWAATLTGLALFEGESWLEIGNDWNLSNQRVWSMLTDRDGNIWISSTKGLDRFSRSNLVSVNLPPTYVNLTLLTGEGGDIWVASASRNPLLRISGEEIIARSRPMEVASFYRDSGGYCLIAMLLNAFEVPVPEADFS